MIEITVICQEEGRSAILIYELEVDNPEDKDEVEKAVQLEADTTRKMRPLLVFDGDIELLADWRCPVP